MTTFAFQLPPLFDYFATFLWALSGAIVGTVVMTAWLLIFPLAGLRHYRRWRTR
jgi:hypothetical protein